MPRLCLADITPAVPASAGTCWIGNKNRDLLSGNVLGGVFVGDVSVSVKKKTQLKQDFFCLSARRSSCSDSSHCGNQSPGRVFAARPRSTTQQIPLKQTSTGVSVVLFFLLAVVLGRCVCTEAHPRAGGALAVTLLLLGLHLQALLPAGSCCNPVISSTDCASSSTFPNPFLSSAS